MQHAARQRVEHKTDDDSKDDDSDTEITARHDAIQSHQKVKDRLDDDKLKDIHWVLPYSALRFVTDY